MERLMISDLAVLVKGQGRSNSSWITVIPRANCHSPVSFEKRQVNFCFKLSSANLSRTDGFSHFLEKRSGRYPEPETTLSMLPADQTRSTVPHIRRISLWSIWAIKHYVMKLGSTSCRKAARHAWTKYTTNQHALMLSRTGILSLTGSFDFGNYQIVDRKGNSESSPLCQSLVITTVSMFRSQSGKQPSSTRWKFTIANLRPPSRIDESSHVVAASSSPRGHDRRHYLFYTKVSILLYYLRINPERWFRYSTIAALVLSVVYTPAFMCGIAFSCQPVKKAYDPLIPGKCLNITPAFLAASIGNPIDLIVLIIPIPVVIKLQANLWTKSILASIFFVSSCTIIVSAVRLKATVTFQHTPDWSWETITALSLAIVEYNLSVVCGSVWSCAPSAGGTSLGSLAPPDIGVRRTHRLASTSTVDPVGRIPEAQAVGWRGRSLFTNDDDEEFKSLSTELVRVDGTCTGTIGRNDMSERDGAVDEVLAAERERWRSYGDMKNSGASAETTRSSLRNTLPTAREENSILKIVSLDVR
ncbi:MAG: hypothetical protein Q9166_004437 [cf. Caloplaca sp. 2 TL-2023]